MPHINATKKYPFTKMEGAGNDYIYFNCFDTNIPDPEKFARILSHRRFGIGGDGVVLICPSKTADAGMRMFNQDGSEGLMCGNAIRCVGKYLYDNGIVRRETVTVSTPSGIKALTLFPKNGEIERVTVDMGSPELTPTKIPVKLGGDSVAGRTVPIAGGLWKITCVSMGNPHCVVFCEDPDGLDLEMLGPLFEHDPLFPERVNTEFVRVISENSLQMRVWERGSGETWACGTGACAAAVAAVENGLCKKGAEITIHLRGGELTVRYTDNGVFMTGPARRVFDGVVEI
ncbi:MAG: diaminopimelate epimerase [Oscillospiraceae bacterium]|jgi:carbamoyl-phosphate synthase large subunit|nr:diaminopimelate epimerase [Oscillospiraceae bacterium]